MKLPAIVFLSAIIACSGDSQSRSAPAPDSVTPARGATASSPDVSSPAPGSSGQPTIELTGSVGGAPLSMSGAGECKHSRDAYIYGIASSMWMVSTSGVPRLTATIWRPKSGAPDQVQVNLETPSQAHEIDTVTGDKKTAGSASVSIDARASGGRIGIDGRDANGVPVRIEIDCSSFSAIQVEGG